MSEPIIYRGTLTEEEQDVLSGMMIIFLRSAEKCLSMLENHFFLEYQASKEYNMLKKKLGKLRADMILKEQVSNIIRGDERNKLGKLLEQGNAFHNTFEKIFNNGMKAHKDDIKDEEAFDFMINDANFLVYLYALIGNCEEEIDSIRILSSVKALAKGHRVSDNLLEKLKVTV